MLLSLCLRITVPSYIGPEGVLVANTLVALSEDDDANQVFTNDAPTEPATEEQVETTPAATLRLYLPVIATEP